jgi:hypothetical protein
MSARHTRTSAEPTGRISRRGVIVGIGICLVVAAALAGRVVAAQFDDGRDLANAIGMDPLVRVAEIPSGDGSPGRGVFVQETRTGHLCVWEAPSATSRERGGGCNPVDDPLGGRALSVTFSYDGGPAVADVKSATLFGLAASEVARAHVVMSDGTRREIRLKTIELADDDVRVFGLRFKKADLRRNVTPTAVVALDAVGREIDRQATGFTG